MIVRSVLLVVLLGCAHRPAAPADASPAACPPGEVVQWIADVCFWQHETDDIVHPGVQACLDARLADVGPEVDDPCAAKRSLKRDWCALAEARQATPHVDGCVADPSRMGSTVRDGGVGT